MRPQLRQKMVRVCYHQRRPQPRAHLRKLVTSGCPACMQRAPAPSAVLCSMLLSSSSRPASSSCPGLPDGLQRSKSAVQRRLTTARPLVCPCAPALIQHVPVGPFRTWRSALQTVRCCLPLCLRAGSLQDSKRIALFHVAPRPAWLRRLSTMQRHAALMSQRWAASYQRGAWLRQRSPAGQAQCAIHAAQRVHWPCVIMVHEQLLIGGAGSVMRSLR
jgi:hypothetical protein